MDLPSVIAIFGTPGALAIGAGLMKLYDRFVASKKERSDAAAAEREAARKAELAEDEAARKHAMDLGAALSSGAAANERLTAAVGNLVTSMEVFRGELAGHSRTLTEIDARGARTEAAGTERAERMRSVVEEQRALDARIEAALLALIGDVREVLTMVRQSSAPPPPPRPATLPPSTRLGPLLLPPTPPPSPSPPTKPQGDSP